MNRVSRFLRSAFGIVTLGCLALAGWAVWSAGLFDGPVAQQVRTSSVYTAPGMSLDQAAAERIIGNRRLVVAFLPEGADLRQACEDISRAADGTLALLLSPKDGGTDYDKYGCALLPEVDDENFGSAFVAETVIGAGIDGFVDRPLEALKVAVTNFDLLTRTGAAPTEARTVNPSLPRYLTAAAAVTAVLLGAGLLYASARRAARIASRRQARRDAADDARSELAAASAVLAQQIIDLDTRYAKGPDLSGDFAGVYRRLVTEYADLLPELSSAEADVPGLTIRVEKLIKRSRALSNSG